jgi:glutathione S-transferase
MLEELGLLYDLSVVDLRGGAHKTNTYFAIHPLGKVPALEIDGALIFESLAICLYLGDRNRVARLAPPHEERHARMRYLTWMAFSTGTLEPAIIDELRVRKAAEQGIQAIDMGPVQTRYERAAKYVESILDERPYLLGADFSAADIMNGSMMIWADSLGFLEGLENTKYWVTRLRERPAYRRATNN